MIELSKIYSATNDGLDIILYYYPQAEKCLQKLNQPFKLRKETVSSAYIKKIGDCWRVTDFGDDQIAHKPIDICMCEENVSFREAIQILAQKWSRSIVKNSVFGRWNGTALQKRMTQEIGQLPLVNSF